MTYLRLDATWVELRQNELYLKLLSDVVTDTLTADELSGIQAKILIYENDVEVVIGSINSAHDTIEVKRDDKTIYLSQSRILNLVNADTIKLIQGFHDGALNRELINPAKADRLFKISKVGISKDLIRKFETNLSELNILKDALPLNNAHQLSFVLLSGQYKGNDLKKFAVKCQDNKWYYLKGIKIIYSETNAKFIRSSSLLNQCYDGLQSTLSLSDLEVFNFGQNEDDIITSKFLFVKGLNPELLLGDGEVTEQLDFLYNGWKNLPHALREYKRNAEWENVLNFIPTQYILNGVHTDDEILPEECIVWCQNDNSKKEFLKALGVNVDDSYIESVRLFLLAEKSNYPGEIDTLKFNTTLLLNTLNGLAGDFATLNKYPFIYSGEKHFVQIQEIEKIINYLIENKIECPLLAYNDLDSYKLVKQDEASFYRIEQDLHTKLKHDSSNGLNFVYSDYCIVKDTLLLNEKIKSNIAELIFES